MFKIYDALYAVDNNIWVGYLERRLRTTTSDVVVEDVRYVHEANKLREMGFTLIRVVPNKRASPGHVLHGTTNPGTIMLAEMYSRGMTPYKIDYSLYKEVGKIENFWAAMDEVIDKLRSDEYNKNRTDVLFDSSEVEHEETQRAFDEDID